MKKILIRKFLKASLIMCFIEHDYAYSSEYRKTEVVENQMNDRFANKLKVHDICFTRFLMSAPEKTTIVYGRLTAGGEISRLKNQAENLGNIIQEMIKENERNHHLFPKDEDVDFAVDAPILINGVNITHLVNIVGFSYYDIYTFIKIGNDAYVIEAKGMPKSLVREYLGKNLSTAKHLRALEEKTVPDDPGICLDGVISTIDSPYEGIEMGLRLHDHPDVHFSITIMKNRDFLQKFDLAKDIANGQKEAAEKGLGAWASHLKVLRLRKRVVNNWDGEEALLRIPSGYGKPSVHKFTFRASGKTNAALYPFVQMTLDTGVKGNMSTGQKPSLSDEAALALWDSLLNSIRVRPNALVPSATTTAKQNDSLPKSAPTEE
ncbi:T6SS immunity protein Tli4 family protein [Duganella qianjiadongensis]|uniref:Tle cognate immunity protein 4 C-terminal domain-containing protein n=1 Tax=Duganella qianjiadongensis TaxID=2692176 RepID=A0ABW9VRV3_9BURK|nr:T6SS immunity protein Tli4 family protein [Duganella qianjiadongensis]MYM41258.1 hypothetical protein [Duganella qianjiadongensis]